MVIAGDRRALDEFVRTGYLAREDLARRWVRRHHVISNPNIVDEAKQHRGERPVPPAAQSKRALCLKLSLDAGDSSVARQRSQIGNRRKR
jgi:hypothetical protein